MEQATVLNATEQVVGQIMPLEQEKIVLIHAVSAEVLVPVRNVEALEDCNSMLARHRVGGLKTLKLKEFNLFEYEELQEEMRQWDFQSH